jgi:hypothetical protein
VGFDLARLWFRSAAVLLRIPPKPLISETSILAMTELDLLKKPEYIHVVLNHLPIFGTIFGAFALATSLILRSRTARSDQMAEICRAVSDPHPGRSNSVFRNRGLYRPTRRSSKASGISAR